MTSHEHASSDERSELATVLRAAGFSLPVGVLVLLWHEPWWHAFALWVLSTAMTILAFVREGYRDRR